MSAFMWQVPACAQQPADHPPSIRVATYNVSLYRKQQGQLLEDLQQGDQQARSIALVLQTVRPDIVLLNEFDYTGTSQAIDLFRNRYLNKPQAGSEPIHYPYYYTGPVNTGLASALDLDGDGKDDGPGDAYGWGRYTGQYGMLLLSQFPIYQEGVRSFQKFLWKDMPDAKLPQNPETGESYYTPQALSILRLSSKSHWDVPIQVKLGKRNHTMHFLCLHPTPPVFDGLENRNGLRNHDEIRFWADYIDPGRGDYIADDQGTKGGLPAGELFVIMGNLNADPVDGDSSGENIDQLLKHPLINATVTPNSQGAVKSSHRHFNLNAGHRGDPSHDTADFSGDEQGNLRVDYVLPSRELLSLRAGIYWPKEGEAGSQAIRASDHRLVYVDLSFTPPKGDKHCGASQ